MNDSNDIICFLQKQISDWLRIEWASLKSCPSARGDGRFAAIRELIDRCGQLSAPPLEQWRDKIPPLLWTAKSLGAGKKTWCLLNRRLAQAPDGEVALERKLVDPPNEGWWAQVPTSSGFNVRGAKKRSIDLVQETGNGAFRFIELKTNPSTNNPLYAAAELMIYGILYACIRASGDLRAYLHVDSQKLMTASGVEFGVFAPKPYYEASLNEADHWTKLRHFEEKVSDAFASLGGNEVRMTFTFRIFEEPGSRKTFEEARPLSA